MKFLTVILSFVFLGMAFVLAGNTGAHAKEPSSSQAGFQRVLETHELRCGYFAYPPFVIKDLKTGEFSGIYPDILAHIAKESGFKITWAEEVGSDTMFEGLKRGRYDAICAPLTYTIARAKEAYFVDPFIFVPFYVYVRDGDTRFNQDPKVLLNTPAVTFVAKDGDLTEILARESFPKAKIMSLPGLSDAAVMYMHVTSKKVDAVIAEPIYAGVYMRSNPKSIRPIKSLGPVQVIPGTIGVPFGDNEFLQFLDISLKSMVDTGFIRSVVEKYVQNVDDLMFSAPPFDHAK